MSKLIILMKKIIIFLLIVSATMFYSVSCKKESNDDYKVTPQWYGTYECEKKFTIFYNTRDSTTVIVEVFTTDNDSVAYVMEHTIYDLNRWYGYEVHAYINITSGNFEGVSKEWNYFRKSSRYVMGSFCNDSLYMKLYDGYDSKPTEPDSINSRQIIRYEGVKIK